MHLLLPLEQVGPSAGVQACRAHRPLRGAASSTGSCGPSPALWATWASHATRDKENGLHGRLCRPGTTLSSPPPCCWPAEAARGPGESPRLAIACKHMDTEKEKPRRSTQKRHGRAEKSQSPLNLQTSEMLKACARRQGPCPEQATGALSQGSRGRAPSTLLLGTARSHWVLRVVALGRHPAFRWTAQDVSFSPSPRGTTLYGTNKVGWGRVRRSRGTQVPAAPRPRAGYPGRLEASAWLQGCGGAMQALGEPRGGHRAPLSPAGETAQSGQPHLRASAEEPPARPTV